jgi:exopolysaccharide biosynthesis polyprenyl glycosylphosphotransferase
MRSSWQSHYFLWVVFADFVMVAISLWLASLLRLNLDIGMEGPNFAFYTPLHLYWMVCIIWGFVFYHTDVYHLKAKPSLITLLRSSFISHCMASLIFLGILYLTYRDYSRLQAFYFIAIGGVGLMTLRILMLNIYRYQAKASVIIVGVDEKAYQLTQILHTNQWSSHQIAGYVTFTDQETPLNAAIASKLLGTLEQLPDLVQQHHAEEVLITLKWFDQTVSDTISQVMRLLHHYPVNIRLVPDYSELAYFHASAENFAGITLVSVRETILSPLQRVIKRAFDIAFAFVALLISAPLMALIALAIKLDSPGPVIFKQQRVGERGRVFNMYKFRSMHVDAPPQSPKRKDNPWVTNIGAFLRRTSLDELPQFVNVLLGDMSVVGPRPEMPWLVEKYEWWQRKRFEVPAGLTGWWQINGRAERPMHLNTELDLYYIKNYSIWLDFQIIFRTFLIIFTGRGAY